MSDWAFFLMLVVAVAMGFGLGRWQGRSRYADQPGRSLEPHYLQGLNYLLNERPDAAIDSFIDSLDVTHETLETHLALGNLLRKRGEVDRAIRIHQNLLSRPYLGEDQTLHVQLELARDFISAGLLDRAELLLQELLDSGSLTIRNQCLRYLIDIYQDEKEWHRAIDAINQLAGKRFSRLQEEWRPIQAHYFCELAEDALQAGDHGQARRHLQDAVLANKQSARSSLLLGELELKQDHWVASLKALKQVFHQDPALMPVALPTIRAAYVAMNDNSGLMDYLQDILRQSGSPAVALELASLVAKYEGVHQALSFLKQKSDLHGYLHIASQMLAYQAEVESSAEDSGVALAQSVVSRLLAAAVQYRCQQCGFSGQQFHWLCPSCKTWDTVKPVE